MPKERLLKLKPKHWWQWLSPKWHRQCKLIQAFLDANEHVYLEAMREAYTNMILYGCSILSTEWSAKSMAMANQLRDLLDDKNKKPRLP